MSATVWTTLIGLLITAVGTIAFPVYLNRTKRQDTSIDQKSVDSREVAKMFKDERDRLQLRLDTMQADYERRMHELRLENAKALAEVEATWKARHERDQDQIADLRTELQGLYRQLYQPPAPRQAP